MAGSPEGAPFQDLSMDQAVAFMETSKVDQGDYYAWLEQRYLAVVDEINAAAAAKNISMRDSSFSEWIRLSHPDNVGLVTDELDLLQIYIYREMVISAHERGLPLPIVTFEGEDGKATAAWINHKNVIRSDGDSDNSAWAQEIKYHKGE